jgi:hypothetical protein
MMEKPVDHLSFLHRYCGGFFSFGSTCVFFLTITFPIMATLDMMPDPAAWKLVQKVISRINPKVAQVELGQVLAPAPVRSLEDSGFLPEARKKLR